MKKLFLSVAVIALLGAPAIANAQSTNTDANAGAAVGGAAGGATGAVVGGLVFGPIGAVIGGFTGATIGASAGVQASSVEYARLNPTEPVVINGKIDVGYAVPAEIELHPIQDDPAYGYFYTNDRLYFVNLSDRTVVYSPGVVVAAKAN